MSYFLVNEELFQISRGGLQVGTRENRFLAILKELSVADFPKASYQQPAIKIRVPHKVYFFSRKRVVKDLSFQGCNLTHVVLLQIYMLNGIFGVIYCSYKCLFALIGA